MRRDAAFSQPSAGIRRRGKACLFHPNNEYPYGPQSHQEFRYTHLSTVSTELVALVNL